MKVFPGNLKKRDMCRIWPHHSPIPNSSLHYSNTYHTNRPERPASALTRVRIALRYIYFNFKLTYIPTLARDVLVIRGPKTTAGANHPICLSFSELVANADKTRQ